MLLLIALLGGIGVLFGVFGRWQFLGWHGREQATMSFRTWHVQLALPGP